MFLSRSTHERRAARTRRHEQTCLTNVLADVTGRTAPPARIGQELFPSRGRDSSTKSTGPVPGIKRRSFTPPIHALLPLFQKPLAVARSFFLARTWTCTVELGGYNAQASDNLCTTNSQHRLYLQNNTVVLAIERDYYCSRTVPVVR